MRADEKWVFVRAVNGAAIFQHPKPPGGKLVLNALVKDDHAVRYVFLKAVARHRIPFTLLAGNDGGHAAIL